MSCRELTGSVLTRVVAAFAVCLPACSSHGQNADSPVEKVYWETYLRLAGNRIGCHFTLERFWPKNDTAIHALMIDDDPAVRSVDALVRKLSDQVRPMTFRKCIRNPSVIHVIESELLGLNGYALDAKVSINYQGTIDLLAWELHQSVDAINRKTSGLTREVFDDHLTKVSIAAKDRRVREILTDCVPLNGYHTILWRAETRMVGGQPNTTIQYYGPKGFVP